MTTAEAADLFGVKREAIRRRFHRGELAGVEVHRPQGSALLIEVPALAEASDTADTQLASWDASQASVTPPQLALALTKLTDLLDDRQRELDVLRERAVRAETERDLLRAQLAQAVIAQASTAHRPGVWARLRAWLPVHLDGAHDRPGPLAASPTQHLVGPEARPQGPEVGAGAEPAAGHPTVGDGWVGDDVPGPPTPTAAEGERLVIHAGLR